VQESGFLYVIRSADTLLNLRRQETETTAPMNLEWAMAHNKLLQRTAASPLAKFSVVSLAKWVVIVARLARPAAAAEPIRWCKS